MPFSRTSITKSPKFVKNGRNGHQPTEPYIEYSPITGGHIAQICPQCGDLAVTGVYPGQLMQRWRQVQAADWRCVTCQEERDAARDWRIFGPPPGGEWYPELASEPLTREERFAFDELKRELDDEGGWWA